MSRASALHHPGVVHDAERTHMSAASTLPSQESARHGPSDSPWLFFAAPVSFALTLIIAAWISLHSF
jgi:hypothetical protein